MSERTRAYIYIYVCGFGRVRNIGLRSASDRTDDCLTRTLLLAS